MRLLVAEGVGDRGGAVRVVVQPYDELTVAVELAEYATLVVVLGALDDRVGGIDDARQPMGVLVLVGPRPAQHIRRARQIAGRRIVGVAHLTAAVIDDLFDPALRVVAEGDETRTVIL